MIDTVLLGFGEAGAAFRRPRPTSRSRRSRTSRRQGTARRGRPRGTGSSSTCTPPRRAGMVRMAQVFAEQAKPAGFNINVIVTPADSYWDDTWLKQPFLTSAWSMRPPGEGLAVAYSQDAKETHWEPGLRCAPAQGQHRRGGRAQSALPAGRAHPRRGGRRDHPDVRPPGAGDAPGLLRLRAACAELQPELRDSELRVRQVRRPAPFL